MFDAPTPKRSAALSRAAVGCDLLWGNTAVSPLIYPARVPTAI